MPAKLVSPVVKLGKQKIITGTIVDVMGNLCSVRMSTRGGVLHALKFIGPTPAVGDQVFIDYRSGTPVVHTSSDNLEAAIEEVRREIQSGPATNIVIPAPAPETTQPVFQDPGFGISESEADTPENDDEFGFWDVIDLIQKKITWENIVILLTAIFDLLYADIAHNHDADYADVDHTHSGGGGGVMLVMMPDVSSPPVPVETPDGADWVYYEI